MFFQSKVELQFFFWRRRDTYQTPQAKAHRKHEADLTNLQKATEDALQGVLFKNDKDVNCIRSVMVEQGADVNGRVVIGIRRGSDTPNVMAEFPEEVGLLLDEMDSEEENDNAWG